MDTQNQYDEFSKVIGEFIVDLLATFPEYRHTLHPGIISCLERTQYLKFMKSLASKNEEEDQEEGEDIGDDYDAKLDAEIELEEKKKDNAYVFETDGFKELLDHCKCVYPPRFFDIIYQNNDIFADKEIDTTFLPNINFSQIWDSDITDKTRDIIWKYLQMVLLTCVPDVSDGKSFGDTAKLFEAIDEVEFKGKLEETLKSMQSMFGNDDDEDTGENDNDDPSGNKFNIPNADDIHSHINEMLGGKLGKLAGEIAEETAQDLGIDFSKETDLPGVFKKLFKNPGKLMSMVKGIGSKLEGKMNSGELSQAELMKEASEMMKKMKDVPGMENMDKILKQFGIPTGKANAFQAHMNQNVKSSQTRERMLKKLEKNKERKMNSSTNEIISDKPTNVFSKDEKQIKSSINDKPNGKKKKKNKKKKNLK